MERVTKYWIDTSNRVRSALKVVATPMSYEMTLYNSGFPNGKKLEGTNFYKISIGSNSNYDVVNEAKFNEYISGMGK